MAKLNKKEQIMIGEMKPGIKYDAYGKVRMNTARTLVGKGLVKYSSRPSLTSLWHTIEII